MHWHLVAAIIGALLLALRKLFAAVLDFIFLTGIAGYIIASIPGSG